MHRFGRLVCRILPMERFFPSEPSEILEELEVTNIFATAIIFLGIFIEVVILFFERPAEPKSTAHEFWIPLIANVLIGYGLLLEIQVTRLAIKASRADRLLSEKEVAEAKNRAADAEEKLHKFRTARRDTITRDKREALVRLLTQFEGQEFDTGVGIGGEQIHFLWDLENILIDSGWRQVDWKSPGQAFCFTRANRKIVGAVSADNVEIQLHPSSASVLSAVAESLADALNSAEIDARVTPYLFDNLNQKAIHVLIGSKF